MAQNATYLEEYLDDISSVPKEIKRNFNLMRELDQNTVVLQQEIATLQSSGRGGKKLTAREKAKSNRNSKSKGGNDKKNEKALEYIQKQHQKAMSNAEEKVAIAAQAYDLVDRAIRELDQKLQKFETELQQGKYAVHNIDENDANNENVYDAGPLKGLKRPRPGSSWEDLGLVPKPVTVSRKSSLATTSSILASNVSDRSSISANVNFVSNKANGIVAIPALSKMPIDPNEPTYCFCNRVSFGEMVGCDNDDCEIEWFHYACVGLTEQPKGKWYCPQCEAIMAGAAQNKKKKGRR
eukprot:GSMAST32.ASY1.ANO1.1779.1 assembled CDS